MPDMFIPSQAFGGVEPTPTKVETMWIIENATGKKLFIKRCRFDPTLHTEISEFEAKNDVEEAVVLSTPIEVSAPAVITPIETETETTITPIEEMSTLETIAETSNDSDPVPQDSDFETTVEQATDFVTDPPLDTEAPYVQESAQEYSKMTMKELRDLCKSRGIKVSNKHKKTDFIAFLQQS
jgi:hypothetical protein